MHPPVPRLALGVGITGHRSVRLLQEKIPDIRRDVGTVLDAITDIVSGAHKRYAAFFTGERPRLSLVSALAGGADSIAAEGALARGYELDAVLPFHAGEYETDFSASERESFFRLRSRAGVVLELDGVRGDASAAYEAAGHAMLDAADILIAIWDGKPSAGRGSTVEIINEAVRRGMPIIRIDAAGSAPPHVLWRELSQRRRVRLHLDDHPAGSLAEVLEPTIDAILRPPRSLAERQAYERYISEVVSVWSLRLEFVFLMGLVFVRSPRWRDFRVPMPHEWTATDASGVLARAFNFADSVGVHFAQTFRSAFVSNFVLSALATIAGAIEWSGIEIVLVLLLVVNTVIGQRQHWHHRWIEARELAERLRVSMAMQVALTRPFGPYGDTPAWTSWYERAVLRESGLPSGRLDREKLKNARDCLADMILQERDYHARSARQFHLLNSRLSQLGQFLFILALGVALFFLIDGASGVGLVWKDLLRFFSVSLPAFGAAFYGIRVIGDFDGSAQRSSRMRLQLDQLLNTLRTSPLSYDSLRDVAHHFADIALGDVANWRLVVESRQLEMPA